MADKELYDYLDTVTPDKIVTLTIAPVGVSQGPLLSEVATKRVLINRSVDGISEERINFGSSGKIDAYISIRYDVLSDADAGTILEYWASADYGDGMTNSFYFQNLKDGHTYVVRFDSDLSRLQAPTWMGFAEIRLKILGRKLDV